MAATPKVCNEDQLRLPVSPILRVGRKFAAEEDERELLEAATKQRLVKTMTENTSQYVIVIYEV
jgi:hypothetical protein